MRALVRPESLRLRPAGEGRDPLRARLVERRFGGPATTYLVRLEDGTEVVVAEPGPPRALPDEVGLTLAEGATARAFAAPAQ